MARWSKSWNDIRGPGLLIAVGMALVASLGALAHYANLTAKAPGETGIADPVTTISLPSGVSGSVALWAYAPEASDSPQRTVDTCKPRLTNVILFERMPSLPS